MIEEQTLNIFTDGSYYQKPRRGGIGIKLVYVDHTRNEEIEDIPVFYGFKGATNNQMELQACITALEEAMKSELLRRARKVLIFTDSNYVVKNYQNALFYWSRNGWQTKDKNPVLNAELWRKLLRAAKRIGKRVDIRWIKGHAGNQYNRAVDKAAKKSAKSPLSEDPLGTVTVRRRKTTKMTDIGSVEMKGQRLLVRIITDEYLPTQKKYKFKYEVVSKASRYYGNVDQIFADFPLRAGHRYCVTLNKNTKTPRILKVIEEMGK